MRGRRAFLARLAALSVLVPVRAAAQGFAGLATEAEGFTLPRPDPTFSFPADHGPHHDFRIEWWYVTANLKGPDGTPYGVQWTLFRSALAPAEAEGWDSPQVWFGHAALTTPERHFATERYARGGIGQAGVTAEPFAAWIDEWHLQGETLSDVAMAATGPDFGYDLALVAEGPLVFHGEGGFSVKSDAGQASYYYSQPFYRAEGRLLLPSGTVEVTGRAWLDREWSSQPLEETQEGWDWFSLHFESGERLMLYRLRESGGGAYTAATWIAADGTAEAVPDGYATAEPLESGEVAGRQVPLVWRLRWPERGLDVVTRPVNPNAWMGLTIPYWEGPVSVEGSHDGRGYLEMTGYE
ncbi:lipocalin-like domain-containing protein [Wenxinia marina]|uniref:Putative secreted hydrolase n=1 Tax=Wenxinia marina DSM 24838 TaxID=1123501 RepID=A0A0D0Q7N6_9RHOB|nr:lipocalin-like domain-containing protein [Wenxinia marina]KIQ68477.1 putative secreted hydrolase [Wenxinia marina DSM 24838]GGL66080.1 iron ABC transporter permease [Wenxinia marina]